MTPAPVNIAQTVVYGVAFDPKNSERVARMDLNQLFASVGRLFDLLETRGVDYTLVGGIAMRSYVEGRNTQDVDVVLSRGDLARLPELTVLDENNQFARAVLGDLTVDVLFAENEPFASVRREFTQPRPFAERTVRCATERGLILLKLFALPSLYRQGQLKKARLYESDVADLVEIGVNVTDDVWRRLEAILLTSDVAELRKIIDQVVAKRDHGDDRFANPS
ncbi:MAG: hypothetical protein ACRCT8_03640 [Lacipirellulaceae bacterium]